MVAVHKPPAVHGWHPIALGLIVARGSADLRLGQIQLLRWAAIRQPAGGGECAELARCRRLGTHDLRIAKPEQKAKQPCERCGFHRLRRPKGLLI